MRRPRRDSINAAWRNEGFRGYADYMQTEPFRSDLETLIGLAAVVPTAIMCAEAVPWRCHRSLISDALVARGAEVRHILTAARADAHKLTPFAKVEGMTVTYPAPNEAKRVGRPAAPSTKLTTRATPETRRDVTARRR